MPHCPLDDHACRACQQPVLHEGATWFCACAEVHDTDLYAGVCEIPAHWGMRQGEAISHG